jgi:serine/threonine protein phosphatase PrpC
MPQVSAAVATHPGLRRAGNEDAFCCRPDLGLYAVADGMGGHVAGEVASQLAVEVIATFIADSRGADPAWSWPLPLNETQTIDGNRMSMAFRLAHKRLAAAVEADEELRGMATTAAAVLLGNGTTIVAHVGDSRVYRFRENRLEPLTQDHSWVGEQVRAGMMSDADARRHPWRNVVTRAIGGGADPEVEVAPVELSAGDRLLLCSDGLSAVVTHEKLEALMNEARPLQEACDALIEAANEAGGPDNITVLMIHVDVA